MPTPYGTRLAETGTCGTCLATVPLFTPTGTRARHVLGHPSPTVPGAVCSGANRPPYTRR